MDLIATLRKQHEALVECVTRLDQSVKASESAAVGAEIFNLEKLLTVHLELEDQQLYPALVKLARASGNASQESVAVMFSQNMARISEGLVRFFGRYKSGVADLPRFAREWSSVRQALADRIGSEESTLYPLYLRLSGAPSEQSGRRPSTPISGLKSGSGGKEG